MTRLGVLVSIRRPSLASVLSAATDGRESRGPRQKRQALLPLPACQSRPWPLAVAARWLPQPYQYHRTLVVSAWLCSPPRVHRRLPSAWKCRLAAGCVARARTPRLPCRRDGTAATSDARRLGAALPAHPKSRGGLRLPTKSQVVLGYWLMPKEISGLLSVDGAESVHVWLSQNGIGRDDSLNNIVCFRSESVIGTELS